MEYVTDPAVIETLYGPLDDTEQRRRRHPHLEPVHVDFLAEASMVVVATVGRGGLTCSPRGSRPGGVASVRDPRTIWVPDADWGWGHQTVRNLMDDPRVGLVFMAPTRLQSLRVQGTARVTVDPEALAHWTGDDAPARSVIVVDVDEVRLSGRGPLARAGVWGTEPEPV